MISASGLTCSGYKHLPQDLQNKYINWHNSNCISATITPSVTVEVVYKKEPDPTIEFTPLPTPTIEKTSTVSPIPSYTRMYRKPTPTSYIDGATKFVKDHLPEFMVTGIMGLIAGVAVCKNAFDNHELPTSSVTPTPSVSSPASEAPLPLPPWNLGGDGGSSSVGGGVLPRLRNLLDDIRDKGAPAIAIAQPAIGAVNTTAIAYTALDSAMASPIHEEDDDHPQATEHTPTRRLSIAVAQTGDEVSGMDTSMSDTHAEANITGAINDGEGNA